MILKKVSNSFNFRNRLRFRTVFISFSIFTLKCISKRKSIWTQNGRNIPISSVGIQWHYNVKQQYSLYCWINRTTNFGWKLYEWYWNHGNCAQVWAWHFHYATSILFLMLINDKQNFQFPWWRMKIFEDYAPSPSNYIATFSYQWIRPIRNIFSRLLCQRTSMSAFFILQNSFK